MAARKISPPDVALIQLGSDLHSALNEMAKRRRETKSETVRVALLGLAHAQTGFWEELLIEMNILLAEMTEVASDVGMIEPKHARRLVNELDNVRQHLYGRLDEADGFSSIHWKPKDGDEVRSYADVQRFRAQRGALVEPELQRIRSLADRFMKEAYNADGTAKRRKDIGTRRS